MYLLPEAGYDDYYENADAGQNKGHLSAVEEVENTGVKEDTPSSSPKLKKKVEHKKPTLEIVE